MRTKLLHYVAKLLGLQFKLDGLPYGARLPIASRIVEPSGASVIPR
ncbi:hypothetical protein BH10PSE11_BH10PSE11_30890 [soil metagenome]